MKTSIYLMTSLLLSFLFIFACVIPEDESNIATYSITYSGNGNTGGSVPVDGNKYEQGKSATVKSNSGFLVGTIITAGIKQRFSEWNTRSDGNGTTYLPGESIKLNSNTVLYARYTDDSSVIGKIGPAGGYIFYDKGDSSGGWQYLEALPNYVSLDRVWASSPYITGATGTAIGTGDSNSALIIAYYKEGTYAAKLCDDLTVVYESVTYDDWFLPSTGELIEICNVLAPLGLNDIENDTNRYWSSTEQNSTDAYYINFPTGTQGDDWKHNAALEVRAIRSF